MYIGLPWAKNQSHHWLKCTCRNVLKRIYSRNDYFYRAKKVKYVFIKKTIKSFQKCTYFHNKSLCRSTAIFWFNVLKATHTRTTLNSRPRAVVMACRFYNNILVFILVGVNSRACLRIKKTPNNASY